MKQLLTLLFIGLTSLYAQTVPSYVPTNGLVGWWPFNGNANDVSGNGNNGTNNGASITSDRFGNPNSAYQFTVDGNISWGSAQQRIIVTNPTIPQVNSFTMSSWVFMVAKPSPYTDRPHSIMGRWDGNGTAVFRFQVNNSTTYYNSQTFLTSDLPQIVSCPVLNFNEWHHCLISYDGNIFKQYIDGIMVNSVTINTQIPYSTSDLTFGEIHMSNGHWLFFNGKMDDLGYWSRALTAQEVSLLYSGCADSLNVQPQNFTAYTIPGWANFKCKSTDTAATYQWQQNIGSGWSNLSNFGNYTGATSDSLVITGVTSAMNNYGFRCIVTGCTTDTSDAAVLTVANGIGLGESTLDMLTISPNPTNGVVSMNISVVGTYELRTLDGRILESGTAKRDYDLTKYPKGVYHLRLSTDEGTRVLKVVKN